MQHGPRHLPQHGHRRRGLIDLRLKQWEGINTARMTTQEDIQ